MDGRIIALIVTALSVVSFILITIGIRLIYTSKGIGKRWRKTYATIVRVNKIEHTMNNHTERTGYNYDIKFYDCNGFEKEIKNKVMHCSHGVYNEGDLVAIWYNPNNSDEVADMLGRGLVGKIVTIIGISLLAVSELIVILTSFIQSGVIKFTLY